MFWFLLACDPQPPVVELRLDTARIEAEPLSTEELLALLEDPETASGALDELQARGAVEELEETALHSPDLGARGWAIVGLEGLGQSQDTLKSIQEDAANPELLRVWAAAARVPAASEEELVELRRQARVWPELERPLKQRGAL